MKFECIKLIRCNWNKMDMVLIKLLTACFMCELVGFTAAVPLKDAYYGDLSTRNKRSHPISFSLFGKKPTSFTVPNPIASAQQVLNSFSNLLTPVVASRKINNENAAETPNSINDTKPLKEAPANAPPEGNINIDKSTIMSPPEMFVEPNIAIQSIKPDIYGTVSVNKTESTGIQKAYDNREKQTFNKDNDVKKKDVDISEIDQSVVDAIFKDIRDGTTIEDSAMDYTTETGDYESTTLDDLLRIPGPVVASLLG